jgi:hypothetical protein
MTARSRSLQAMPRMRQDIGEHRLRQLAVIDEQTVAALAQGRRGVHVGRFIPRVEGGNA